MADVRADREQHGHGWGDVALLYRKHDIGERLEAAFLNAGVPCRLPPGRALAEDPVVAYVIAAVRVIANPDDEVFRDGFFRAVLPRALHDEALVQAMKSVGLTPPPDLHERVLGIAAWPVYEMMRDEFGLKLPFDDWIRRKYAHYLKHAPGLKPRAGALEIFRDLQRAGVVQAVVSNSDRLIVEAWMRNAFNAFYVPVAFEYEPAFAPSGFIGEAGRPRTFGVTVGVGF